MSPVTAIRITLSQRCFSSSLSAAKLWVDLDCVRRKLAGGSVGRELSSTEYPRRGMVHWALTS